MSVEKDLTIDDGTVLGMRACDAAIDGPAIRALNRAAFFEIMQRTRAGWDETRAEREPVYPERYRMMIDGDGALVGWFAVRDDVENRLYLQSILVVPAWQHRGVGRAMMARVEETARRLGRGAVRLRVFKANPASRWYPRLGYAAVEDREDDFIMEKRVADVILHQRDVT